jgi:hypothetical protein
LHNQLHPLVPSGTAEGDDVGDDISNMDNDHEETLMRCWNFVCDVWRYPNA